MPVPIRGVPGYRAAPRAALDAFLAAPRLMRLGVTEPDGTPLVHPVWYTWEHDQFLVHIGTQSAKRHAIETQPIVYFTIDDAQSGTVFGVRGKAQCTLALEATRVRGSALHVMLALHRGSRQVVVTDKELTLILDSRVVAFEDSVY